MRFSLSSDSKMMTVKVLKQTGQKWIPFEQLSSFFESDNKENLITASILRKELFLYETICDLDRNALIVSDASKYWIREQLQMLKAQSRDSMLLPVALELFPRKEFRCWEIQTELLKFFWSYTAYMFVRHWFKFDSLVNWCFIPGSRLKISRTLLSYLIWPHSMTECPVSSCWK